MSDVLDRIRAKITRAQQHLEGFRLRLDAFYASKPYTVDIKEDPAVGKRVYYVTKADPVPLDLETIAADVIQNLRSPLDQIAYQLVLAARGGVAPDWPVYYPIRGLVKTHSPFGAPPDMKTVEQDAAYAGRLVARTIARRSHILFGG